MQIYLASQNLNKVREISSLLGYLEKISPSPPSIASPHGLCPFTKGGKSTLFAGRGDPRGRPTDAPKPDLTIHPAPSDFHPDETGATFAENALIKARSLAERISDPQAFYLAEDSGLCVMGLSGSPGIYSARFGGSGLSDRERCAYLLEKLGDSDSRAYFICSLVLVNRDGAICFQTEGFCHGQIVSPLRGEGWGYDPIFEIPYWGSTFGEISPELKNAISHRSRAIARLKQFLESDSLRE